VEQVLGTDIQHIAPKSFETKTSAYIFGVNDAALTSVRNGIVMNSRFEEAFDNGWLFPALGCYKANFE
jgi:hypothetical protein